MSIERIDHVDRQALLRSPPHGTRPFPTGVWALDTAQTTVRVKSSRWLLLSLTSTLRVAEGMVEVDDNGEIQQMEIVMLAGSARSGSAWMDRHLQRRACLDVEHHPHIVYSGRASRDVVQGTLQMKEHRVGVTMTTTKAAVGEDGRAHFSAYGSVDRGSIGLGINQALMIGSEIWVEVQGVALRG